jgi:exosome complex component RRP42
MNMGDTKDTVMRQMRRDVLLNSLTKGVRYDGRAFDQFRPINIQKGVIKTSEGSALAEIGGTKVLASVKLDVATPFPDRPKEGVMISNAELLCSANPSFESGPPDENSIEFARVVDRALRSAEVVDTKTFFIEEGKVLALFVDLYVLDHTGNYMDAGTMAASAALLDAKMPKVEDGKIIRGEFTGPLNPKAVPISSTFVKLGDHWLIDPSYDEELAHDTRVTIATTKDHVCAMQKGRGKMTKSELMTNIDIAFKKGQEIRDIIQK